MALIEKVLPGAETERLRAFIADAPKRDGRATAGRGGQDKKDCLAVRPDAEGYADAGRRIERAVLSDPRVAAIAFPRALSTVHMLVYAEGGRYDAHRDLPLMGGLRGAPVRADVSATLFLNGPDEYDGGGLSAAGQAMPKGRPGDLLLYDGGQRHAVEPVTRGHRTVAVFWIESFVPDERDRTLLRDFDEACAPLRRGTSMGDEGRTAMSDLYARLLRRFSS